MGDPGMDEFGEAVAEQMDIVKAGQAKAIVFEIGFFGPLVDDLVWKPKGMIDIELKGPHVWIGGKEFRGEVVECHGDIHKEEGALGGHVIVGEVEMSSVVALGYESVGQFLGHGSEEPELGFVVAVDPNGVLHGLNIG